MGGLFSKPKAPVPAPDPELERQRREAKERAEKEKADLEAKRREEAAQRSRNMRGRRSLLSEENTGQGFTLGNKTTLGE